MKHYIFTSQQWSILVSFLLNLNSQEPITSDVNLLWNLTFSEYWQQVKQERMTLKCYYFLSVYFMVYSLLLSLHRDREISTWRPTSSVWARDRSASRWSLEPCCHPSQEIHRNSLLSVCFHCSLVKFEAQRCGRQMVHIQATEHSISTNPLVLFRK